LVIKLIPKFCQSLVDKLGGWALTASGERDYHITACELAGHMQTIAAQICAGKLQDRTHDRSPAEINLTARLRSDYPTYFAQIEALAAAQPKRSALRQLLLDLGLVKSA
jgi:hypothetical protein